MSRIEKAMEIAAKRRESIADDEVLPVKLMPAKLMPAKSSDLKQALEAKPLQINNAMLVSALPGNDPATEEYKKLKSLVLELTREDQQFLNTLMISSTLSEEGKSMTALNLAVTMAKDYDHTVLLIDTDLRRPSLHKYLNIDPDIGLIQCLKDGVPLENALIKTGLGKLVFLPAGGIVDDPSELLSSMQMKNLVDEMKNRYPERYVIFDTPPSLLFADAQVLAKIVDSLLFVVREGVAKPSQIKEALAGFQGANLLGVVYNDAAQTGKKNRYHYYY